MADRYRVNRPLVISEVFEDEVVIVNFDDGTYYSLRGSGVEVWEAVEAGHDLPGIIAHVAERREAVDGEIEAAVLALVGQLEGERLIEPADPATAPEPGTPSPFPGPRRPFEPPLLETYTDMQELLLLDPIHEVDEGGWPRRKPA